MRSSRAVPLRALSVLGVALLAVVLIAGISPGATKFLTKQKAKKLFYTKAKADQRFLTVEELGQTVEGWHEVGAAGEPAFGTAPGCSPSCWQNVGLPYHTVGFYKDPFGVVHLRGGALCIAPTACTSDVARALIFTLPEGYRPPAAVISQPFFTATAENISVFIPPAGALSIGGFMPETGWVSLDGITFRAA